MTKKVVTVNEKDEMTGTMSREKAHQNKTPDRISVTYVENNNKILIQKRANGRLDHSAAGHVDPGETYEEAAKRELEEELGITNTPLTFVGKGRTEVDDEERNQYFIHFFHVFKCKAQPKKLQSEEVQKVYWENPNAILEDMRDNPDSKKYSPGFRNSLPIYLKKS